jgi:hypothetical protein
MISRTAATRLAGAVDFGSTRVKSVAKTFASELHSIGAGS